LSLLSFNINVLHNSFNVKDSFSKIPLADGVYAIAGLTMPAKREKGGSSSVSLSESRSRS
jgi:hypothetical protein